MTLISDSDLEQIVAFLDFCSKKHPDQEARSSAGVLKEEMETALNETKRGEELDRITMERIHFNR